jgi:hypothetical protein
MEFSDINILGRMQMMLTPHHADEGSFTFATCMALALCTVGGKGDLEWAYALLY